MSNTPILEQLEELAIVRADSKEGQHTLIKLLLEWEKLAQIEVPVVEQLSSSIRREFIRALAVYVLRKRAMEIYKKTGRIILRSYHVGVGGSCGVSIDYEHARDHYKDVEDKLLMEDGWTLQRLRDLKLALGRSWSTYGAFKRVMDMVFGSDEITVMEGEIPREALWD